MTVSIGVSNCSLLYINFHALATNIKNKLLFLTFTYKNCDKECTHVYNIVKNCNWLPRFFYNFFNFDSFRNLVLSSFIISIRTYYKTQKLTLIVFLVHVIYKRIICTTNHIKHKNKL